MSGVCDIRISYCFPPESVKTTGAFFVKKELEAQGYLCSCQRDLFSGAMDPQNIALLPVLICEGHDKTRVVRHGQTKSVKTMRDNVLFEIGLCTMAPGMNGVILLTESETRLPEDLKTYQKAAAETADYLNSVSEEIHAILEVKDLVRDMDLFIRQNQMILSPTVIGASVSTVSGLFSASRRSAMKESCWRGKRNSAFFRMKKSSSISFCL